MLYTCELIFSTNRGCILLLCHPCEIRQPLLHMHDDFALEVLAPSLECRLTLPVASKVDECLISSDLF